MTETITSIADQVRDLEDRLQAALDDKADVLASVRQVGSHLSAALDALGILLDGDGAEDAVGRNGIAAPAAEEPKPTRERRSDEEWGRLEEAVLVALSRASEPEINVRTIAMVASIESRTVSLVMQRLLKRDDVDVRPGEKKGYWRLAGDRDGITAKRSRFIDELRDAKADLMTPKPYKPTDDEGEDGATDVGSSSVEQG